MIIAGKVLFILTNITGTAEHYNGWHRFIRILTAPFEGFF
jgi:hypothetical protein